jgi:hypothetical protein
MKPKQKPLFVNEKGKIIIQIVNTATKSLKLLRIVPNFSQKLRENN